MTTMKTIAAAVAAALALGTSMSVRAETGDQDVPRMNTPHNQPNVPPPGAPTRAIKVNPGDVPPADMRRGEARRYEQAAQNGGYMTERQPEYRNYRGYRDYGDRNYREHGYRDDRGYRDYRPNEYRAWHRGDRLPRSWYGSSYIVYDWRPYRLYSPPYGYHWVRVGDDVLLTAIATGIVLDVIYDIWY